MMIFSTVKSIEYSKLLLRFDYQKYPNIYLIPFILSAVFIYFLTQIRLFSFGLALFTAVWHLHLVQKTFSYCAQITEREIRSTTNWDLFILTGINTKTVIWAKWKNIIAKVWREFIVLGLGHIISAIVIVSTASNNLRIEWNGVFFSILIIIFLMWMVLQLSFVVITAIFISFNLEQVTYRPLTTYLLITGGSSVILLILITAYSVYVIQERPDWFYSTSHTNIQEGFFGSIAILLDTGALSLSWPLYSVLRFGDEEWAGLVTFGITSLIYFLLIYTLRHMSQQKLYHYGMIKP